MHTFIVRVLVAADVAELTGVVEDPLSGRRSPFHDRADLVVVLERAIGRPSAGDRSDGDPANATGGPSEPRRP
jgi:hypothetical protein